jgi:hypothetical protein
MVSFLAGRDFHVHLWAVVRFSHEIHALGFILFMLVLGSCEIFLFEMSCFWVHNFRMRFPDESSQFSPHNLLISCHAFWGR